MKCPVCYTNIPLGDNRCPNCGMIIKTDKSSIQTQYAQPILDQAHNKTNQFQKELTDFLNQRKQKTIINPKSSAQKQMKSLIGGWNIIFVVLMILFIIRMFVGVTFNFIGNSETYYSLNEAYEVVEDDGTIEEVMNIKSNIENGLFDYYNVSYDERVEVSGNSIEVAVNYIGQYGNCNVTVCIEATDGEITYYTITFDGYYKGSPTWNKIPFREDTITYMMDDLGYMNAYEDYEKIRMEAIKNNYNDYYEMKFEDYIISLHEYYEEDYDESFYQFVYIVK